MSISVDRPEDMSPTGVLTLHCQRDGDIVLVIQQTHDAMTMGELAQPIVAQVEFCVSGGQSPQTLHALRELAAAMARDNANPNRRRGCVWYDGAEMLSPKPRCNCGRTMCPICCEG